MNREQLKEKLEIVKESEYTIGELHFLIEKEGILEIKKGNVDEDTQIKLSEAFIKDAIEYFSDEELEVRNLSDYDERKNVIYLYDYDTGLNEFDFIKTVRENDSYSEYSFKHDDISNLKGYIVTYLHDDFKITIYKQHYPIFLLKRDKNILLKFSGSNQIDELEEDIFRINSSFDFIILDDDLYIKDIEKLEKHYGFHEIVKNNAMNSVGEIEKLGIVEDISQLECMVDNITYARKLIKVSKKSPVLNEVPKENIMKFISDYSGGFLSRTIKLNDEKTALVLKTKKSRITFLKILNDDFLFSELTKYRYDSLAKDVVKNEA